VGWYPQTCPVCIGDMYDDVLDVGWVTCMMCARSFAAGDVLAIQRAARSARQPVEWRERASTVDLLAS